MPERLPESRSLQRDRFSLRSLLPLLAATAAIALVMDAVGLPAAMLLGAMAAAAGLAASGRCVGKVPLPLFVFGQSVIGCLIAGSLSREILLAILGNLPMFLALVLSVAALCALAGWLLARSGLVPGTTALWGTSPGAALIMTMMSERYGADARLVAFMQYLRVILVTACASVVAGIWAPSDAMPPVARSSLHAASWQGHAGTVALCLGLTILCLAVRRTSGVILVALVAGGIANLSGVLHPLVHPWLLAAANVLVGWGIGLRFTRPVLAHAARILPWAALTFLLLIVGGGGIGVLLGQCIGVDPLTAFLAAAPGGLDAMTIITASIGGDMSFVTAVQTTRFLVVVVTGPAVASVLSRRIAPPETTGKGEKP